MKATLDFGFESIKLDGCGVETNVTLFAELFNQSGKRVMLENCHNGNPTYPSSQGGAVNCPMNFFRSSGVQLTTCLSYLFAHAHLRMCRTSGRRSAVCSAIL